MPKTYQYGVFMFSIAVVFDILSKEKCTRYDKTCPLYAEVNHPISDFLFADGKTTCKTFNTFLKKLETALKNDDADQVAELIDYSRPFSWYSKQQVKKHPIKKNKKHRYDVKIVNGKTQYFVKKNIDIKNRNEFKRYYKKIFTPKIKEMAMTAPAVSMGYQGFMIDRGSIWFDPRPGKGLITINGDVYT